MFDKDFLSAEMAIKKIVLRHIINLQPNQKLSENMRMLKLVYDIINWLLLLIESFLLNNLQM